MLKGDKFIHQFLISNNIYDGFVETFGDRNILHIDSEYAKSKGFKEKVMQGNILNGFISYFVGEILPVKNVIIQSQNIKFSLPFYLNETLEFNAEISDFFESVNTYQFEYYFLNLENKKIAKGKLQIGLLI